MGLEGSISHHCLSLHKHGTCFPAPVLHTSAATLVSLSIVLFVTSLTLSLHLITISLNSHLFAVFFLCCQRNPVVFVQRGYIGSCLNLVCALLHSPAWKTCSLVKCNSYIFAFVHMKIRDSEVPTLWFN